MTASPTPAPTSPPQAVHAHPLPPAILLRVFGALLALTLVTVAVTRLDLGNLNIWIALLIAVLKASLVALYFMHLRYETPLYGMILIVALFFVALFIGIALLDSHEYQPNLQPPLSMPAKP